MRKFSKNFSKHVSLESNKETKALEKRIKDLEHDIQNLDDNQKYLTCKNKLEAIYNEIVNGMKIRSCCDWQKIFIFFFILKNIEQLKVKSVPFFIITR